MLIVQIQLLDGFKSSPPLSGFGKIKLGESYFLKGENDKASELNKRRLD